jgi:hemoglobin-like flavoprotein
MDIQASLDRVLQQQDLVIERFYALFQDRYPEVRRHFEGANLRRLALMLTVTLMVAVRRQVSPAPVPELYLKYLGTKHHDLGVPPESYPKFRDALLATLQGFHGEDWNAGLAAQWAEALDHTAETMLDGYRERFHV